MFNLLIIFMDWGSPSPFRRYYLLNLQKLGKGNSLFNIGRYSGGYHFVVPHRAFLLDGLGAEQVALARASAHDLSGSRNLEAFYYGFLSLLHILIKNKVQIQPHLNRLVQPFFYFFLPARFLSSGAGDFASAKYFPRFDSFFSFGAGYLLRKYLPHFDSFFLFWRGVFAPQLFTPLRR